MHNFDHITIYPEVSIHSVGNQMDTTSFMLSGTPLSLSPELTEALKIFFLSQFKKEEYFRFSISKEEADNQVYQSVFNIFHDISTLHQESQRIATFLHESSVHPQIKKGEFYVVYFKKCLIDHQETDAIGLFKSESKDTFLKVQQIGDSFEIEPERGVNINKLDKGCLIFNTAEEEGYKMAIVDNTNRNTEAKYWTNDFLHIAPYEDNYFQTQQIMELCKSFVEETIQPTEATGKVEQAMLLNKSLEALKKKDININRFAEEVFEQPERIEHFKQFKKDYQKKNNITLQDDFEAAPQAFKRKGMGTMTTIRLDKNFDINIHGGEQLIERGYDEEKGMYYYRLFFIEER